jgi:hypothetical protein
MLTPLEDFINRQCDETWVVGLKDVVQDNFKLLINAFRKVGFVSLSFSLFDFGKSVITISIMISDYCCKILIYSFEMKLKANNILCSID